MFSGILRVGWTCASGSGRGGTLARLCSLAASTIVVVLAPHSDASASECSDWRVLVEELGVDDPLVDGGSALSFDGCSGPPRLGERWRLQTPRLGATTVCSGVNLRAFDVKLIADGLRRGFLETEERLESGYVHLNGFLPARGT